MMLLKCCAHYASKFGKFNSGHRTGKGLFSFQSQRRAMPKTTNYHMTAFISHALSSKVMFKILQARLQQLCDLRNSRCTSWVLKRQRNQRSNCQHLLYHAESQGIQKNIYFCFIDQVKTFDCMDHNKLWKILKR